MSGGCPGKVVVRVEWWWASTVPVPAARASPARFAALTRAPLRYAKGADSPTALDSAALRHSAAPLDSCLRRNDGDGWGGDA